MFGLKRAILNHLGVVRRDLKPGKILIEKEDNAGIMDFGIVRSLNVKRSTGAGVMIYAR